MALYWKVGLNRSPSGWLEWHLGQELPVMPRVAEFQADGDELEIILDSLRVASERVKNIEGGVMKGESK